MIDKQQKERINKVIRESVKKNKSLSILKALGHEINIKEDIGLINKIIQQWDTEKHEGPNKYINKIIYAETDEEKIRIIKKYKEELGSHEFSTIFIIIIGYQLLSDETIEKLSE